MRFEKVLDDVERLVGKRLSSIRPGAEILLTQIDRTRRQLELQTKDGQLKTRPLSELEAIWDALLKRPAVHVDKILDGSGSSRNQPETILANLPYIEYFHDGVKHLAYVDKPTHTLGTIKEMDPLQSDSLRQRLRAWSRAIGTLVVTDHVADTCRMLEKVTGLTVKPLGMGVYRLEWDSGQVIIATPSELDNKVSPGVYPVIPGRRAPESGITLQVGDLDMCVVDSGDLKIAIVY